MRKLQTSDLFSFARVIKASGIRDELVGYLQTISKDSDKEQVGMKTILMIVEALSGAEKEVYKALAPVFERNDLDTMPPQEFFGLLKQMSEENDLVSFFGSLFGTVGKN